MENRRVAVCVVSHDSAADLPACLAAVAALDYEPLEVVVVDCASRDDSLQVVRSGVPAGLALKVISLPENLGFAGGMNAALRGSDAPLVLSLNPDARPEPAFLRRLVECLERVGGRVGAVTGRLVRPGPTESRRLDACGMRLTWTWRHLDRGSGRRDRGQFSVPERVFGATGAATLFLRRALDDVAIDGSVFDPDFFTYREDAELCFRLRERRWEVLYEPAAIAVHRRFNLPSRRRRMPAAINMHSLKNRYLLRCYHQTLPNLLVTLVPTVWRDALALGYVLLCEPGSRAAYAWLWTRRRSIWARRRVLRQRRTAGTWEVERWFVRTARPLR